VCLIRRYVNILGTFWQHIISAFVEMTKAHSCSGILGCQAPRFLEIWNDRRTLPQKWKQYVQQHLPVNKFQVQKLLLLLLLLFFVSFIYTIIKLSSGRLTRNLAGQLLPISGLKKKKKIKFNWADENPI